MERATQARRVNRAELRDVLETLKSFELLHRVTWVSLTSEGCQITLTSGKQSLPEVATESARDVREPQNPIVDELRRGFPGCQLPAEVE